MKQLVFQRNVALTALLVVFAGGCAAMMPAPPGAVGSKEAPGMVVHIDPTTGEFLPEPPPGDVTPPLSEQPAKTQPPKFNVVPSPTPGGGYMIDTKDHFHTPLVATMDANGKVTLKHESPIIPAGTEDK